MTFKILDELIYSKYVFTVAASRIQPIYLLLPLQQYFKQKRNNDPRTFPEYFLILMSAAASTDTSSAVSADAAVDILLKSGGNS